MIEPINSCGRYTKRNDSHWFSSGMASGAGDAGIYDRVCGLPVVAPATRRRGNGTPALDGAGRRNSGCADREPVAGDRRTVAHSDGGLEEREGFGAAALAWRKDDRRGPVGWLAGRISREKAERNPAADG